MVRVTGVAMAAVLAGACGSTDASWSEESPMDCVAGDGTVPAVVVESDAGVIAFCPELPTGGTDGGGSGAPESGNVDPLAPVATAEWTDSKTLVLTISENADLGPYDFGMTETGNGGGIGWEGEDCLDFVADGYDLCHEVPPDGVLTLTSIHPDQGGTIDMLEEGRTTLMDQPRSAGLTYVLIRWTDDPNCWTWGQNPQHYIDELGCTPSYRR